MDLSPLEIITVATVFWLLLYLVNKRWPLKKYGLEVGPLYVMRRTQRLNNFLQRTAERHPTFWRGVWNFGILVAFGQIIFAGYSLASNLYRFLSMPQTAQPVFLLLPGITISLTWFPYLMTAIALTLITHEFAHGIAACGEKLKIKSAGIILALVTIGGFIEPDEEQFQKLSTSAKLRVISSGSFINLIVGFLIILLMNGLILSSSGVVIQGVRADGPAYEAGLKPWDIVYAVNDTTINDVYEISWLLRSLQPGDVVKFNSSRGVLVVVAEPSVHNSSMGSLGVQWVNYYPLRFGGGAFLGYHTRLFFDWILLVLINVSIFNMLPLYPLDGDAYVWAIVEKHSKKAAKTMRILLSLASLMLLASNVGLTFMRYGFTPI